VSGKGAPAAIYAGVVAGILRSHAPMEPAPAEMLTAVNYSLVERRIDAQFVSLIYCIWDDANLTLQVANSGLPRPVYCHKGKTQLIEATGLPLGLFEDAEYDEFVLQAEPDDIFVFFSDGILDATNRVGDLFGRTRLEKIIAECSSQPAQSIVKSIFKAARDHASGVETFDDQTVVAIKVKGSTPPRT
jgi:phosphoserine phosphatase RsbU/P